LLFNVIINLILVVALTYVAMPSLAKLFRRWLYPPL
jgi:antibiotic biosynthesis monooxygenase (ABM) superfamily enzyme